MEQVENNISGIEDKVYIFEHSIKIKKKSEVQTECARPMEHN
jgi:hypothetical protein